MEALLQIDYKLFHFLNTAFSNPFFDWFMPFITKSSHIIIGMLLTYIIYGVITKDKKRALIFMGLSIIVFAITDASAYRIFKPFFGRMRPCNPQYFIDGVHTFLDGAHFLKGMSGTLSFPSNHAANAFGLATFWILCFPRRWYYYATVGLLVSYSRIYVGVHYPFDIAAGGVLGVASAFLVSFSYRAILKRVTNRPPTEEIRESA